MNKKIFTHPIFVISFLLVIGLTCFLIFRSKQETVQLIYSEFWAKLQENQIAKVTIANNEVQGELSDGTKFKTTTPFFPGDPDLYEVLKEKGVKIEIKNPDNFFSSVFGNLLFSFVPVVIMSLVIFLVFIKPMIDRSHRNAEKFTDSQAKSIKSQTKFTDVAGLDEAKQEVQEVIEFLKNPRKFAVLGGKIPRGLLFVGPAGCGKTLLARAVAGEANVPFFIISGSNFVEMYVGVGAGRVRNLFNNARKYAPCIIFIDELDAVGRHRGAGLGGGHDEREQTLNQILVEMDGFEKEKIPVIVMAATNRPDILDPALLRPGRFNRQIVLDRPDIKAREAALKVHTRQVPLADDVDLAKIAKSTPGFTFADLENLVNEAAILAARKNANKVYMKHFDQSRDKVILGLERKIVISEEEQKTTAIHELGHTLVARFIPEIDPPEKVSIIPRGFALGVTQQLLEKERYIPTKSYLKGQISMMLGGRAAEEIINGPENISTGAQNDLKRATALAKKMVCEFGMGSTNIRTFGDKKEEVFLGLEIAQTRDYSEETAREIDEDMNKILAEAYQRAKNILEEHKKDFEKLTEVLLEKEALTAKEIDQILNIQK